MRPHARTQIRRKMKNPNESSFICGTVKKPWGSNVVIAEKSRVLKRISKKDGALQKHMNWLKDLQEKRKKLDEKKKVEESERLERKRIFQEREAKKRLRSSNSNNISASPQDANEGDLTNSSLHATNDDKKPVWAKSEVAHKESQEIAVINEEADLLDFVDNLDFEQYAEDLELKSLVSQLSNRIKTLRKEKKRDETRLQTILDSESAALRAEAFEQNTIVDLLPGDVENEDIKYDDVKSIASVMSESSLGSIHSRKSLANLLTKVKEGIASKRLSAIAENGIEKAVPPPRLITHTDDDGARLAEKNSLNKLPFKNRNPAL
mmetsp:Transcript_11773/g.25124  ORF Transcript_11773/g.25124 Transcript_11773/m.25124 type:complete len:321 (+) Transcript_11773:116-1078(+)